MLPKNNPVIGYLYITICCIFLFQSGGRGYARANTANLPSVRSLAGPQRFPTAADQQAGAASYQFRLQRQVSAPPPQQSSPNPQLPGIHNYFYDCLSF